MTQCDARTLTSTYSTPHRCMKRSGVKRIGKRNLCAHHRGMRDRGSALSASRRRDP